VSEAESIQSNPKRAINQSIIALMKYDKTHIMTKYVLIRVLKKHAN